MTLVIPDETLDGLRSASHDALVDMACRLFDADRISKPEALRLTNLSRVAFENELGKRGLARVHIEYDDSMRRELDELRAKWEKPRA